MITYVYRLREKIKNSAQNLGNMKLNKGKTFDTWDFHFSAHIYFKIIIVHCTLGKSSRTLTYNFQTDLFPAKSFIYLINSETWKSKNEKYPFFMFARFYRILITQIQASK